MKIPFKMTNCVQEQNKCYTELLAKYEFNFTSVRAPFYGCYRALYCNMSRAMTHADLHINILGT